MDKNKPVLDAFVSGLGLLSIPFFILFIASWLFIFGFSINPFIFPISVVLSLFVIYYFTRTDRPLFIRSSLFHIFFLLIVLLVSAYVYDSSYDGQRYHQDSISRLRDGWNPIYDSDIDARLWVKHYAKGMETISASIFCTTGNVEAGKAINFILVFASLFFFYNFLSIYFDFLSTRKRAFLSMIFTFSTVVINQLFSYYVDWSMVSLLLIFISTLLCLNKTQSGYYYLVAGIVVFLSVTIKFNILFWVLYVAFFFLLYLLFARRFSCFKRSLLTFFVSGCMGLFIGAINPYVTNTINQHDPFYPLTDKVDLIEENTPPSLVGKNRIEAFLISTFSFPNNDKFATKTELALPTNLTLKNVHHSGKNDGLVGGYGLFFSWILIASTILYILLYKTNLEKVKYYNCFLLLLLLAVFVLPLGWGARYFPLFYAFPLIMLLYSEYEQSKKWVRYFRNGIYFLVVVNMIISIVVTLGTGIYKKRMVDDYVRTLSGSTTPINIDFYGNVSFRLKLEEAGIKYYEMDVDKNPLILDTAIFSPPIYIESSKLK
ncbi:MAG: hypothetical protein ACK5MK_09165 [Dysgonomonas sp.]